MEIKHPRYYKATRHKMYKSIQEFFKDSKQVFQNVLDIDGSGPLLEMINTGNVTTISFPKHDVQNLKDFPNEAFDLVLCDQVLEHVRKPWLASMSMRRVLKVGGLAVVTSVFMYPIHNWPSDYWRFTTDGLRVLFEHFDVLECKGWGNREIINATIKGQKHTISSGKRFIETNDEICPMMTWVIARK